MLDISNLPIDPDEIINFLKRDIQLRQISQKLLYRRVVEQTATERNIIVTPEEIQAEVDRVRHEMRLEKASDALTWLASQMITPEDWEAGIHDHLLGKKLSEFLFSQKVEKFFAQNRLNYEQVLLYQIIVNDEKIAQELFYQIEEQEISFYEAAHFYDIDEERRRRCGYGGKLYRRQLAPDIASAVFGASLGELIGPLNIEPGYRLLMVEEFIPAELTPEIHQEIINRMFREWLESECNYLIHNQII
ncbi:MAG: peptidylprolyl isomerase [Symploca sp. SIO3C6]|nr:peptidylprolyl isomerase [Symploca sp. SIO3C6]